MAFNRHFGYKYSHFGEDTKGHDLKAFGDTTGKYLFFDASADTLYVVGTLAQTGAQTISSTLTVTGLSSLNGGIAVVTDKFTVSAAGAVVAASTVKSTGDFTVGDAKLVVTAASGNTLLKGSLGAGTNGTTFTVAADGALAIATSALTVSAAGAVAGTGTVSIVNTPTSTTPGTIRAVIGEVVPTPATTITSGTLAGVRGHLSFPSGKTVTGGAYLVGAQGKLTFAGTMNHEDSRLAGLFAQLDLTGATLTAGQLSGLWVDMGVGATGAGGGQFNMIRVSNTVVDSKPNSVMYVYADATNLFDLAGGPNGAQSYVVAAGVTSGSWGNANGVASKVLVISIGGTPYYIPVHTQNT